MIDLSAFDAFGATVLVLLLGVIPIMSVKEFGLLVRWVRRGREDARIRFYRWVMAYEWVLTLVLLAWWLGLGRGANELGLVPAAFEWQWLAVVAGLLLSFLLILQMNMVLASNEQLLKVRDSIGKLKPLAPHDNREQGVFLQLSITAGICEEILYRGFLMFVLTQAVGQWPALILTAAIFGLAHSYQGTEGLAKTSGRIMQAAVNTWNELV